MDKGNGHTQWDPFICDVGLELEITAVSKVGKASIT